MPEKQVRQLLAVARRRTFKRGEVVFHRDDPADSMHLIVKGRFALRVMTPLGEPVTIAVRGPGDSFGEMALVGGTPRSATVESLEESETFCVYESEFHRSRNEQPEVDRMLIAFLTNEVRMLDERLLEALYVPVERRVLYDEQGGEIVVALTQEEIAGLAGASRATVNQVLRAEEKRGTIEPRRGKTVVVDRDAVTKRAR